jgi:hypothetical protein
LTSADQCAAYDADEEARKNTMMRVFEYAVSHAVKENEMTEHDGQQVLQCWADAEVCLLFA